MSVINDKSERLSQTMRTSREVTTATTQVVSSVVDCTPGYSALGHRTHKHHQISFLLNGSRGVEIAYMYASTNQHRSRLNSPNNQLCTLRIVQKFPEQKENKIS